MMLSSRRRNVHRAAARIAVVAALPWIAASPSWASGGSENALLIIDPTDRESLLVGNYYRDARNIPDRNVIFLDPSAADFASFNQLNVPAVRGSLAVQQIEDHIDFVILPPDGTYRLPASGLVSDGCSAVLNFSSSGTYTLTYVADEVLGGVPVETANHFSTTSTLARAFDGSATWLNGSPSASGAARRYLIGASLGYTGPRGNSIQEILDNIDRSVLADGTRPIGTFYYMQTTDEARSGPRHDFYPAAVASIQGLGDSADHLFDVLPTGMHDCLGIMTGWAAPDIGGADMTIVPGAFCDHLTSWAATFDIANQAKVSRWIEKGASGSAGAIEEPCNYSGKFPTANVHVFYDQGLSLGEAYYRSMQFLPFQNLLYGDPLTRAFTHIPTVSVPDAPASPVSGMLVLTPVAGTTHPTAQIAGYELLVDGVSRATAATAESLELDTTELSDGYHELRVLASDDTLVEATGRWIGSMEVDNHGRSLMANVNVTSGNLSTAYDFTFATTGGPADEWRIVHGSRVIGSTTSGGATVTVYGWQLGPGPVRVQAEALFADLSFVRSAPIEIDVADATATASSGGVPFAFSYTKKVHRSEPFLVELPASFDTDFADAVYTIETPPASATVVSGSTGPYRVMHPDPGVSGFDSFTFQVQTPGGTSNLATVTLIYGGAPANDLCASGPLLAAAGQPFDTIDAGTDGFSEPGECADFGHDVWYKFIVPCAGLVTISTCDSDFDTMLGVYAACPTGPDQALYCSDDDCGVQSRVSFNAPGPALYRVRVGGAAGSTGSGTIVATCNPCPGDCAPAAGDGTVDILDLLALLSAWGAAGSPCDIAGDVPAGPDDVVDILDLLALLSGWGSCP